MKRMLFLLLTLCLLLPLCACADTEDGYTAPDGYKLLSNEIVDYYAIVPDEWVVDMSTGVVSAKCSDRTNLSIITQTLNTELTPESYWETYGVKNAGVLGEVTYLTEGAPLLLARKDADQVKALRYTYSATIDGEEFVFDQVIAILNGQVYILTLTATAENYTDAHKNEYTDILDRFLFRV